MNTIYISVGIGIPGLISDKLPWYTYDYDPEKHQEKNPEFYFEISSAGGQSGELKRLLDLIKAVEVLAEGSGYENYFSVTVHNCGPRDAEIKNTLINIESEDGPLKWTTEALRAGIPKGGSFQNLQYIGENETEGNSINGNGGQYYGDPNNKRVLADETDSESNILWESFNTKYEVYRDCGLVLIDGGWKNKPSDGVNNVGVASKGMPVRVFTSSTDLQIVDYNIGNVTEENNFQGDYSHLPKLKTGESLDLFFGIRVNRLANIDENVQLVFNTDDGSIKKSDCYAEIKFPIKLNEVIEPETEPIEVQPSPIECPVQEIANRLKDAFIKEFTEKNGAPLWKVMVDSIGAEVFGDAFNDASGKPDLKLVINKLTDKYHQQFPATDTGSFLRSITFQNIRDFQNLQPYDSVQFWFGFREGHPLNSSPRNSSISLDRYGTSFCDMIGAMKGSCIKTYSSKEWGDDRPYLSELNLIWGNQDIRKEVLPYFLLENSGAIGGFYGYGFTSNKWLINDLRHMVNVGQFFDMLLFQLSYYMYNSSGDEILYPNGASKYGQYTGEGHKFSSNTIKRSAGSAKSQSGPAPGKTETLQFLSYLDKEGSLLSYFMDNDWCKKN